MSDNRKAVIVSVLESWRGHSSNDTVARYILEALDQRATVTKWEGKRADLMEKADGLSIPRDDLLDQLNALPGAPLTKGDLRAKMDGFDQGKPEQQAGCLAVYREKGRYGIHRNSRPDPHRGYYASI